jgi:DNA helicase-2/ATP-dependent DNA helicase PcrA
MIQTFGIHSHLIALADADQRIYEFRGADPKRIGEFITAFNPAQFDFGNENRRSDGTDITQFGNDLLTGANQGRIYQHVKVSRYGFYSGYKTVYCLKTALVDALRRCKKREPSDWAIAILVPSKRLMLAVSTYLDSTIDNMPAISHDVAMDTTGPALAGVLIAFVLESSDDVAGTLHGLLQRLCRHIYGRRGDSPATAAERGLVGAINTFIECGKLRGTRRIALVNAARQILAGRSSILLTGDPGEDWLAVRKLFENAFAEELRCVAQDATYLRLLHKGASLRSKMNELWRKSRSYSGAEDAVREALLQEHLSSPIRAVKGIQVMTIHKAKGKEFSEVLIYEDSYQRLVRPNASENDVAQARLTLRVGVTRAKFRTLILTPKDNPCILV